MYLSKSIYVSVWSCPKGAWISKYHPEWVVISEDQQARFDTGHEVGEIAQGIRLFPVRPGVPGCGR